MINQNKNSRQNLVFPEDTCSIIFDILEKYGLREDNKEIMEKWKREEEGNSEIVAKIFRDTIKKGLSSQKFSDLIKEKLNISSEKSRKISDELQKDVLSLIKVEKETGNSKVIKKTISQELGHRKTKNKKIDKKDTYRELIE